LNRVAREKKGGCIFRTFVKQEGKVTDVGAMPWIISEG